MIDVQAAFERAIGETLEGIVQKMVLDLLANHPTLQQKLSTYVERELEQVVRELTKQEPS
ncbi:hypothetical protein [Nitrospira sp. Nam74]